jgi:D-3-phosphoglycerate dehydrogenase
LLDILALTDKFITSALVEDVLNERLAPVEEFRLRTLTSDWPITPLHRGEEVDEFVGSEKAVTREVAQADLLLTHVGPVSSKVLQAAPRLRAIGVPRGGPLNVNVRAATERGVPVINAPGRNAPVVAEFTLGMILALVRNIARSHEDLRAGTWRGDFYVYELSGFELDGSTAGLIGYGNIGARVSRLLQAFGVRVLVYDPFVEAEVVREQGGEPVELSRLLGESDIVSLHLRQTADTMGFMNAERFRAMKPGAVFVNTARGGMVDYESLAAVLRSGRLAGAALDTYDNEPLRANSPLRELENVVLTPHIGGASMQTARRGVEMVVSDFVRLIRGERPERCMNAEVLPAGGYPTSP